MKVSWVALRVHSGAAVRMWPRRRRGEGGDEDGLLCPRNFYLFGICRSREMKLANLRDLSDSLQGIQSTTRLGNHTVGSDLCTFLCLTPISLNI